MQIFVSKITGETIAIDVDPGDTVRNVYSKINGCSIKGELYDQRLIFAGQTLNDDRMLIDYNVKSGSTIFQSLVLRGGTMTIMVQLVGRGTRNITVQVESTDTIKRLKEKIHDRLPQIPTDNIHLIFGVDRLEDNKAKISDYAFQHGSTLQLIVRMRGGSRD